MLEIDDFTAQEPFVYRQDDSYWNNGKYYLPDGSQVFYMVNSEPANPLTLEAEGEGSAEGTWITSSDENWYDHPTLRSLDLDGDGVISLS